MAPGVVTTQNLRGASRYTRNSAALGPDFVRKSLYKKLTLIHDRIAEYINMVHIKRLHAATRIYYQGCHNSSAKEPNIVDPAKYRLIK